MVGRPSNDSTKGTNTQHTRTELKLEDELKFQLHAVTLIYLDYKCNTRRRSVTLYFFSFLSATSQENIGNYSRGGKHAERVCDSHRTHFCAFSSYDVMKKYGKTVNGEDRIANLWFECLFAPPLVCKN